MVGENSQRDERTWLFAIRLSAHPDEIVVKNIKMSVPKLTSLERLFGVSGFAGLLEIQEITNKYPGYRQPMQQIAIDRFTGGVTRALLIQKPMLPLNGILICASTLRAQML